MVLHADQACKRMQFLGRSRVSWFVGIIVHPKYGEYLGSIYSSIYIYVRLYNIHHMWDIIVQDLSHILTYTYIYIHIINIYIYCIILYHICEVFPKNWGDSQKQPDKQHPSRDLLRWWLGVCPGPALGSGLRPGNLLRSAGVSVSKRARGARGPKKRGGDVGFNGLVENDENSGDIWWYVLLMN